MVGIISNGLADLMRQQIKKNKSSESYILDGDIVYLSLDKSRFKTFKKSDIISITNNGSFVKNVPADYILNLKKDKIAITEKQYDFIIKLFEEKESK